MSVFIYIPKKTSILKNRDWLIFLCFSFFLLLIFLEHFILSENELLNIVIKIIGISFCFLMIYLMFSSLNEKEKLKGILKGEILLNDQEVILGSEHFKLKEIKNMSIIFDDYENKYEQHLMGTYYPSISSFFEIKLKNGDSKKVQFQQKYENEIIKKNKEKLIFYHKQGVIFFLNLIQLLGIDDYDEIQNFKKQLEG